METNLPIPISQGLCSFTGGYGKLPEGGINVWPTFSPAGRSVITKMAKDHWMPLTSMQGTGGPHPGGQEGVKKRHVFIGDFIV